jgi:hypothetical protein
MGQKNPKFLTTLEFVITLVCACQTTFCISFEPATSKQNFVKFLWFASIPNIFFLFPKLIIELPAFSIFEQQALRCSLRILPDIQVWFSSQIYSRLASWQFVENKGFPSSRYEVAFWTDAVGCKSKFYYHIWLAIVYLCVWSLTLLHMRITCIIIKPPQLTFNSSWLPSYLDGANPYSIN